MAEGAAPAELTDQDILERFQRSEHAHAASRTLGFRIRAVDQAQMRVEIDFDAQADRLANPMGQVQGGFVSAMLDEAMSLAVVVASKLTCVAPTLEMKTSFMRPAMPGHLLAIGRVAKWGRTVAFTEGELYDPAGKLLAKATGTVMPAPYSKFKTTKGAVGG